MKTIGLSVVLATYNEAENIGRCLEAVKDIASEIIIVDGSSTDSTVEIAKSYGAKIVTTTNKPMFHINKQMAIDLAKEPWILQLDADEVVTPKLANEIKDVISMTSAQIESRQIDPAKQALFTRHQQLIEERDGKFPNQGEVVAFFIPRLNMFLGKPLRHGGVYPDPAIRLFKRNTASFPTKSVHELVKITGRVTWLENDMLHFDSPTFKRYLERANRYTSLTAKDMLEKKLPINLLTTINYLVIKPKIIFLSRYFRHKAFLDGFPGFIFALFSGLHFPIAYLKYWELKKINIYNPPQPSLLKRERAITQ
jgi:glycosyltransferase involved in cell wall biosynthesis